MPSLAPRDLTGVSKWKGEGTTPNLEGELKKQKEGKKKAREDRKK
jgi:hypothetical protein